VAATILRGETARICGAGIDLSRTPRRPVTASWAMGILAWLKRRNGSLMSALTPMRSIGQYSVPWGRGRVLSKRKRRRSQPGLRATSLHDSLSSHVAASIVVYVAVRADPHYVGPVFVLPFLVIGIGRVAMISKPTCIRP